MPIYRFHSADGHRVLDREGVDLPDDGAAREEAVRLAGAVLAHNPDELWKAGHWRIEVTDARNILLFTVITVVVDAPRPEMLDQG